jgi:hypothetical protein
MSFSKNRVIKLNKKEILDKIENPPNNGDWILAIDPINLEGRIVKRGLNGFIANIEGHEDLFPLSIVLERSDGFIKGGDWIVAHSSNKREHDGIYRSYRIKWIK